MSMDYWKEFEARMLEIDCSYIDREDRNRFASEWISSQILPQGGDILNIGGGGKRHLQSKLGDSYQVFEVDLQGDCDLLFDLDSGSLPLEGKTFNLSCAFDVLEHLENFHSVLDDIFRVSKNGVLLSLPVATGQALWSNFIFLSNRLDSHQSGVRNKFYGLPLSSPKDRHRWWLSFADIVRYFTYFEEANSATVRFAIPFRSTKGFKKSLIKLLIGRERLYELFVPYVWIHIDKT
jgi:hypothetical protein